MTQLTFWSEEHLASLFPLPGSEKDLKIQGETLPLPMLEFLTNLDPSGAFGKTCRVSLVPGGGRDFGSFLGALVELGYGFAYRVLDAQYFGVPQRRRRVFVVGCLGDWESAAKVLFEPESLSGNTYKSKKTREGASSYVESSFGQYRQDAIGGTIKASGGALSGGSETFYVAEKSPTLLSSGAGFSRPGNSATEHETYIALQDTSGRDKSQNGKGWNDDGLSYTLDTTGNQGVSNNLSVRRLTEIECERLQGFPDNYTNIKENCPSGPRYKALGNSMAVPVMRWIGSRIIDLEKK